MKKYYIKKQDKVGGPFSLKQISSGIRKGQLESAVLLSQSPEGPWESIETTWRMMGPQVQANAPATQENVAGNDGVNSPEAVNTEYEIGEAVAPDGLNSHQGNFVDTLQDASATQRNYVVSSGANQSDASDGSGSHSSPEEMPPGLARFVKEATSRTKNVFRNKWPRLIIGVVVLIVGSAFAGIFLKDMGVMRGGEVFGLWVFEAVILGCVGIFFALKRRSLTVQESKSQREAALRMEATQEGKFSEKEHIIRQTNALEAIERYLRFIYGCTLAGIILALINWITGIVISMM